jgi:hypothetical protein
MDCFRCAWLEPLEIHIQRVNENRIQHVTGNLRRRWPHLRVGGSTIALRGGADADDEHSICTEVERRTDSTCTDPVYCGETLHQQNTTCSTQVG